MDDRLRVINSDHRKLFLSRKVLKQALKDAPYHHMNKPNKNLIHDDDLDVKSQLERRQRQSLLISRRLSQNPDLEVSIEIQIIIQI